MRSNHALQTFFMRLTLCAAIGGVLSACGQQSAESQSAAPQARAKATISTEAESATESAVAQDAAAGTPQAARAAGTETVQADQLRSSVGTSSDAERQFVIHADLRAKVADVYRAVLAIEEAVQAQGGFVTSNSIETERSGPQSTVKTGQQQRTVTEAYDRRGHMTVRVPANQTQAFLHNITQHLEFLEHRQIHAQDVQLALLRERLNISRNRLLQQNLDDIAARPGTQASQALSAIQAKDRAQYAQDEALLAQKEWQDQVAFSTINLELYQNQIVRTSIEPDMEAILESARPGFALHLREALVEGFEMFQSILLALAHLWPLLVTAAAAVGGWMVYRKNRPRKADANAQHTESASTEKSGSDQG